MLSVARIIVGFLFLQHGAEKLWGFAGGRIDHNFATMRGFAGPLEIVGGSLIVLGMFTRTTAFILCGEMAVAYFRSWAPRGFFPIQNGGEEAVLFCYVYLWLVMAGAGAWSLDRLVERSRSVQDLKIQNTLASWEQYGRSILRFIFAFTFTLHGLRLAFNLLPALAGRRGAMPMPLDLLPGIVGYLEIVCGGLIFAGVFARPAALASSIIALAAYCFGAAPRGFWPVRNGGNEALLYTVVFACLALAGAGTWSLGRIATMRRARAHAPTPVTSRSAAT